MVLARIIWGDTAPWRAGSTSLYQGYGAEPPAGCRGRAPGQEVRGQSPLKLKHFWFLDVQ